MAQLTTCCTCWGDWWLHIWITEHVTDFPVSHCKVAWNHCACTFMDPDRGVPGTCPPYGSCVKTSCIFVIHIEHVGNFSKWDF